jgi:DNA-binding IclR family transcriptional regulator
MQSSIVAKILSLLTIVSQSQKPKTFSELVTASGMNKSTIHRLLGICAEEQLVQFDKQRKVYLLGPKVFDLVRNAYSGYDIQAVALDEMLRLHAQFDGNVTIGIPSGLEVVYLRILEARSSTRSTQQPGMREPIHCSASGKALFAFMPDKVVDAHLANYAFERFTDRTITDAVAFKAALQDVRQAGFAKNDREEYDYFGGISAPIFNYLAEPIAVLNIWCVQAQHPMDEMVGWADALMASADRVTELIGGVRPGNDLFAGR